MEEDTEDTSKLNLNFLVINESQHIIAEISAQQKHNYFLFLGRVYVSASMNQFHF